MKISSRGVETTLTSLQTYTNGANQFLSLSVSPTHELYTLTLQTMLEERKTQLPIADLENAIINQTDVFLCGVPNDLMNVTGEISNFTGCAALSSSMLLHPLPLNCNSDHQNDSCSNCLNEVSYYFYIAIMKSLCYYFVCFYDFRVPFLHHSMEPALLHLLQSLSRRILTLVSPSSPPSQMVYCCTVETQAGYSMIQL